MKHEDAKTINVRVPRAVKDAIQKNINTLYQDEKIRHTVSSYVLMAVEKYLETLEEKGESNEKDTRYIIPPGRSLR